ncbi:thiol:disulfide interchange protein DsbA/DsbL [Methylibium petroleiphilum]|uniref:thiol:disulfide interchange protein DsbA/DsbL n=1 Tax=Methylibium petroleiphilum TaxID=105560 RepID=UPI001729327E|nr:thiol:disulfide interchange protein DsbA/DsbL [Methylibium petroleiphilum]MBN9205902.1 thiol:disulfide interchange protein DsbA/DsbL [Methylibium petroleiphilum]|mmetsp:Transcript_60323/g.148390  ORF Transcript_60323/g.148390 Transcript_60323/m.148390 type:complete len:213 (+) Transcript_60323:572-1210(+)
MDRRQFSRITAISLAAPPALVAAQERPVEGKHYVAVSPRQPTLDPRQVEVLEFFAYGCEHCHAFEPTIDAWQKKLPADVRFRRIPVAFREGPMVMHQKLFFAIETLGLVQQLHGKVFTAMHVERRRFQTPEDVADFGAKNGVDPSGLVGALNSVSAATKAKQATLLATGYKFQGTPSIGVNGRWLTSGSMAGSNEKSLAVAEHLIGLAKQSA